jgi:hypothetical protein
MVRKHSDNVGAG